MPVETQIQIRRGTAASWTSTNPTLAAGEIGFESDTGKFKIGTGSTAWASLAYATNGAAVSPLTTKGDLYTYSTADARLPVGANGETIVADSSTSTGLRYQGSQAAGKNYFINGGFDIWQRGTSFTPTSAAFNYCADRWYESQASGTSGVTMSQSTDTPTGFRYSLKTQRTNGTTGTAAIYTIQGIETINSIPLAGKTVTLSMWVKKGANWSGTVYSNNLYTGTGTDQGGFPSIYTGAANPLGVNIVPTTSWVRYSATGTIASNATQIGLLAQWSPSGTAGADDSLYVTGIQLEIGSVATEFTRAGGTIQGELAACQRYYYRQTATQNAYTRFGIGVGVTSTQVRNVINLPVTMRTGPSSIDFANIGFDGYGTGLIAITAMSFDATAPSVICVDGTVASGITQYKSYSICANNNTSAYLGFSAEL